MQGAEGTGTGLREPAKGGGRVLLNLRSRKWVAVGGRKLEQEGPRVCC